MHLFFTLWVPGRTDNSPTGFNFLERIILVHFAESYYEGNIVLPSCLRTSGIKSEDINLYFKEWVEPETDNKVERVDKNAMEGRIEVEKKSDIVSSVDYVHQDSFFLVIKF